MSFIGHGVYYHYRCDGKNCGKRTEEFPKGKSPPDAMRAWKIQELDDVHLCPECQLKLGQIQFDKAKFGTRRRCEWCKELLPKDFSLDNQTCDKCQDIITSSGMPELK